MDDDPILRHLSYFGDDVDNFDYMSNYNATSLSLETDDATAAEEIVGRILHNCRIPYYQINALRQGDAPESHTELTELPFDVRGVANVQFFSPTNLGGRMRTRCPALPKFGYSTVKVTVAPNGLAVTLHRCKPRSLRKCSLMLLRCFEPC